MIRAIRSYSKPALKASPAQLITRLRKEWEGVPIMKIKQSLQETEYDYEAASEWLRHNLRQHASDMADKVQSRVANEGWTVLANRVGLGSILMKLNCETDFVARNPIFERLAGRVATTALLLQDPNGVGKLMSVDVEDLLQKPLVADSLEYAGADQGSNVASLAAQSAVTIEEGLKEGIAKMREKIQISSGFYVGESSSFPNPDNLTSVFTSSFVHGIHKKWKTVSDVNITLGKIGVLTVFECSAGKEAYTLRNVPDEQMLSSQISQHIAGMSPASVEELLQQPFLFNQDKIVKDVLEDFKLEHQLNSFNVKEFFRMQ